MHRPYLPSPIYIILINSNQGFGSSSTTIYAGTSSDELVQFNGQNTNILQFQLNKLSSINNFLSRTFWNQPYFIIYEANAVIEGLNNYSGVHASVKTELIGEAEFVRAFCNFYLTNLFGDIPLVTTINYHKTTLLARTSQDLIYQAIIADLKDAQSKLASDYSAGNDQRIVPNKWAATALLARVYLYTRDYADAEKQATAVINNSSLYSLTSDLNSVFLVNSTEAIWQLQQTNAVSPFNTTPEGFILIPRVLNSDNFSPYVYLTPTLLKAFEAGDQRKSSWIDSTLYRGVEYYFPYKYKQGPADATANGTYSEYYMVLRLAEQYLIKAEAEAQQGESNAVSDLNVIRNRAALSNYNGATDKTSLLNAILHERQIEFFSEWGHRWLDLKRTGEAKSILSGDKGFTVGSNALLFPIPISELKTDPNLTQNPGY